MNAKQLKFLKQFSSLSRVDAVADEKSLKENMDAFLEIDYQMAADVWEFLCIDKEGTIAADPKVARMFADMIFDLFAAKNRIKAQKTLNEVASVRRAVYQYSPSASSGAFFDLIVEQCVAGKAAECDEIFKCLIKNTAIEDGFGLLMKKILERVFIEILKKSTNKKVEMSKKMTALLLSYISKIKTDEKAMLEQRIREIN